MSSPTALNSSDSWGLDAFVTCAHTSECRCSNEQSLLILKHVVASLARIETRLDSLERTHSENAEREEFRYKNYLLRTHQTFGFRPESTSAAPPAASTALLQDGVGRFVLSSATMPPQPSVVGAGATSTVSHTHPHSRRGGHFGPK